MSELVMVVCLKQVPDPEGPASAFQVDSEAKKVTPVGIPPLINPFDENALEAALQLKNSFGGRIIAVSMGAKLSRPVLTKALAAGADELILLEDEHFADLNSLSTAHVLANAIKRIGKYELIFTGRQASDWDFGQTGLIITEILQIPGISLAQKVKMEEGNVIVEKLNRNGYEVVKASLPALITVSSEVGDLRMASVQAIMAARKKPITVWGISDIEIDPDTLERRKIHSLFAPSRGRNCNLIEGQSSSEKGEKLASRLRDDKVI